MAESVDNKSLVIFGPYILIELTGFWFFWLAGAKVLTHFPSSDAIVAGALLGDRKKSAPAEHPTTTGNILFSLIYSLCNIYSLFHYYYTTSRPGDFLTRTQPVK